MRMWKRKTKNEIGKHEREREREKERKRKEKRKTHVERVIKPITQTSYLASTLALFFKSILFVFLKYNANVNAKDKE